VLPAADLESVLIDNKPQISDEVGVKLLLADKSDVLFAEQWLFLLQRTLHTVIQFAKFGQLLW